MNDQQNADEQTGGAICGFCAGEGEHVIHFALDSAENIYETCPICKGKNHLIENPIVARIWYELNNHVQRWALEWEWLKKSSKGEYVLLEDVLGIVEGHLTTNCTKGGCEMNDHLQNALEQLKCRASGGWEPLHLLPKEAQALLDERDMLRDALKMIASAHTTNEFARRCAHVALAKTQNEET